MVKLMSRAEIEDFFARLKKHNPNPKTELEYTNPYTLLVAVALSAQATDKSVNKATAPLFKQIGTPEKMVALGEARLADAIKTIGLYRGKAKNVIALSKILIEQHGSKVPENRDALEALPGVGRKTGNVVRSVDFGLPGIPVDTHVLRVSKRLELTELDDPVKVELALNALIPPAEGGAFSLRVILHGRATCTARRPACSRCILADICPSAFLWGR